MDLSKRAVIQTVLAFLVGLVLCALFFGYMFQAQQSEPRQAITKTVNVIAETPVIPKLPLQRSKSQLEKTGVITPSKSEPSAKIALITPIPIGQPEPTAAPSSAMQLRIKQMDFVSPCYYSTWASPTTPVKAVLICVHGFGLYSEAFEALGRRLCLKGYPTYSIDTRGFGRYLKTDKSMDFDDSINDVGELIKSIKSKYRKAPIVLIGESMGGALVIQAGAHFQKDIAGIIASAPGDSRFKQGKMDLKVATKLLLRPTKRVEWGDELLEMATSNRQLHEKWRKDPLVRLKVSPAELIKFDRFMSKTGTAAKQILSVPMLFLHGGNDELMKRKGTVELFNDVPSTRKDLFILGQREHVMLEEGQFDDKTIRLVETWLTNSFQVPIIITTKVK